MEKSKLKLHNPIEKHFKVMTRYHYLMFFFLFSSKIPMFWHVLNLIFLSPPMDYFCANQLNSTKNVCPCEEPVWDRSIFTETMQTKFGLICENSWLVSFSQSMFYVGLLIGALGFGFLSDRYGRLSMYLVSCLTLALSGCIVSAMPTIASFIFMRSIEGVGSGGAIITVYVLCIEYCGKRHREIITALFHVPINISHMTLPGISYLLRHCDEFQLAISIPVFLYVGLRWVLLESPKWLMDRDRTDDAVVIMEKFVDFNKHSSGNIKEEIEAYNSRYSHLGRRKIGFFRIFKHRSLALSLLYMSIMYFLCGMGYYGVSQYIGKMSGNIHLNVAISGAVLLPGTIASIFLLKYLKRRTFLMATTFLSGLFMLFTICIPRRFYFVRVVIACVCNCFFFMSFIIVFLISVEIFPTSVRNSVLGFLSFLSRLGQITGPLINTLPEFPAGMIMGLLALVGSFLCFLLPETKDVELPSSIDDSKVLTRKGTIFNTDTVSEQNIRMSAANP